jgi:hypothetical protein
MSSLSKTLHESLITIVFLIFISNSLCWSQKLLPFRIAPYEKNNFKSCLERGRNKCQLDTFEYRGLLMDFQIYGSTSIGEYRRAGRKGAGFGMGMGFEYQPINRFPMTIRADFIALYHDIKNYDAGIPVILSNPPNNATLFMPVNANIKSGLYNMNIGTRLWLPTKYIQPYIMAMVGFVSQSTEVRIYHNESIIWAGISDKGLLYDYSLSGGLAGSRLLAFGISYNADYSLNLDLRVSWLHSKKYSQIASSDVAQWNYTFDGEASEYNPENFQPANLNMKTNSNRTTFDMLLISFGLTAFFE